MIRFPASRRVFHAGPLTRRLSLLAASASLLAGPSGASELLTQAVIRIPSGGYILPGEPITGSVDARVVLPGSGTRSATRVETIGVIRMGELRLPIENGLFVLPSVPVGRTTLQAFGPLEAGAEIGRVELVVLLAPEAPPTIDAAPPASPGPPASPVSVDPWRVPLALLPRDRILVRGPFAGAGDSPRLLIAGIDCPLVWETKRGALFAAPMPPESGGPAGPGEPAATGAPGRGGNPVELSISGAAAARGTIYLPRARFALPDPAEVTSRGEVVSFSADVTGLPPAPEGVAPDGAIADVVFMNLDPEVLVGLWSKSSGARDLPDRLTVPIRPDQVSDDGTFIVRASGKGRAKGPVRLDGALILRQELSGALQPLSPVSQEITQ